MAKKELTIPNWTIFGTHIVSLEVHQFSDEQSETIYQLAVTFFLDDAKPFEKSPEKQKVLTIYTDKMSPKLDDIVYDAAMWAVQMFKNVSDSVYVIAEDGSIAKEIQLTVFMERESEKIGKKIGNSTFVN